MDQWPIELKGYTKHVKPRHKEHMEYNGMSWGMVNQTLFISNDAIHVQVEGGGEDSNV
jgi:hypothetical protein